MNEMTRVLGIVAMEPKGEWNLDTYYEKLNIVTYNDSTYMALEGVQGEIPSTSSKWQLIGGGTTKEDTELVFNNVADMKTADLKEGYTVKTLGYYSVNDGGGATYKITSTESQTDYQEELENELYASLIINDFANIKQFGAKGDGTEDDTISITKAFNMGCKIVSDENNIYLITSDINVSNLNIDFNNSTIKSTTGKEIKGTSTTKNIVIKNTKFDNVCIDDTINNLSNHYYKNCQFYDTDIYGIQLSNVNNIYVDNCLFNNIGKGTINITYQGCGIRTDNAEKLNVINSKFSFCHGTGALVIRNTKLFNVNDNIFDKNDYRGIAIAGDTIVPIGTINNNTIMNNGVYASHNTGVGCNGIYGNGVGDASKITISNNKILNVCENAIEGAFGLVENNYVKGTGVDQVNHPTPSASGINMYGGIYRYNHIENSYLPGLYVSNNIDGNDTVLIDKQIYGNVVGKCVSTPNEAILVNGTEYNNVGIYDNKCDGSITIATNGIFKECVMGNNYNKSGKPYTNTSSSVYLVDKGNILVDGFVINNSTITNIVLTRCSSTIRTNDVLFTATGDNGVIQFPTNCKKNSINCLKIMVNSHSSNSIKCTIMGTKDDDTTSTIAYQKPVEVSNGIASLFVENDNTYKSLTYQFIFGNTNDTIAISNFQVKEITM